MLPRFELIEPDTLAEAVAALAGPGEPPALLAGGTNLLVDMRNRFAGPARLVRLDRVAELKGIEIGEARVRIGSLTTISDLLRREEMETVAPSLVHAARVFAGHMVRNTATVGGNVCYGSPAADMVPPLLSLDASIGLASARGERSLPLGDFLLDYKRTARRPDEVLSAIEWPRPPTGSANLFRKLGLRKGDAITIVGVAVTIGAEDGRCSLARIALGAVAPTVLRAEEAERVLVGEALSPAKVAQAARRAAAACRPIDDLRASASYRRHTVEVLVRRLVTRAWEQAATGGPASQRRPAAGGG
ncbi:MAG: xanthine dehydrogenase family protein subunit M [Alphaproteobacteria bacterium]